jgi:hypothetical protein
VRVKAGVLTPKYNSAVNVNHNSIGVITSISADKKDVIVDFSQFCNIEFLNCPFFVKLLDSAYLLII